MPQSSLLGWLSKPAEVQIPPQAKLPPALETAVDSFSLRSTASSSVKHIKPPAEGTTVETSTSSKPATSNGSNTLPRNVEIRSCTKDDIKGLKQMTGLLLPIQYPESFYRDVIEDPVTNNITLVAVWHDDPSTAGKEKGLLVGAIRCRLLAHPPSSKSATTLKKEGPMLYLSTLVLLSPYRSHGIATQMLNALTKRAVRDYGITSIGAHVWEANLDGLDWYRKRGFSEVNREDGYYRRLKPTTAVVVQRQVGVMDLVGG